MNQLFSKLIIKTAQFFVLIILSFVLKVDNGFGRNYAISEIPDSLKLNANWVIRDYHQQIEVEELELINFDCQFAITVLNEEGLEEMKEFLPIYYDKSFILFYRAELSIYNSNGTRTYNTDKFKDYKTISEVNFYDDDRYKNVDLPKLNLPCTFVLNYELIFTNLLVIPKWIPSLGFYHSIEKASRIVILPEIGWLKFKEINGIPKPKIENDKVFDWEISNQMALLDENLINDKTTILPTLFSSAVKVKVMKYSGVIDNWSDFANFFYQMYQINEKLPEAFVQQIHNLTDTVKDIHNKINLIYQYLQNNFRYVSVQLGIGGWQPYPIQHVFKNKYGDCKGLSNLMVKALEIININAYPVLINGGRNPTIFPDFVTNNFNHAICCVPLANDTLWYECTSQNLSPGFLGNFTANKYGVLLSSKGNGGLIKTPAYNYQVNKQQLLMFNEIDPAGITKAKVRFNYSGLQYENKLNFYTTLSKDEQIATFNNFYKLPSFILENFDFKTFNGKIPSLREYFVFTSNSYVKILGKTLLFKPNMLNKLKSIQPYSNRQNVFSIPYGFIDIDSVYWTFPSEYNNIKLPENILLNTEFGNYMVQFYKNDNQLLYVRKIELFNQSYPPNKYNEYYEFRKKISKYDDLNLILSKQ